MIHIAVMGRRSNGGRIDSFEKVSERVDGCSKEHADANVPLSHISVLTLKL